MLLLALASPLAAAFHLPLTTSHHWSHRTTSIVSAQTSPADATSLDSTGTMSSKIADRVAAKLDAEWGEQEDHVRVGGEAGRFYCEARAAGTVDIGQLLMAIVRHLNPEPNPNRDRPESKGSLRAKVGSTVGAPRQASAFTVCALWQGTGMQTIDMGDCFVGPWDIANDVSDVPQPERRLLPQAGPPLSSQASSDGSAGWPSMLGCSIRRARAARVSLSGVGATVSAAKASISHCHHAGAHERELRRRLRQRLQLQVG